MLAEQEVRNIGNTLCDVEFYALLLTIADRLLEV